MFRIYTMESALHKADRQPQHNDVLGVAYSWFVTFSYQAGKNMKILRHQILVGYLVSESDYSHAAPFKM